MLYCGHCKRDDTGTVPKTKASEVLPNRDFKTAPTSKTGQELYKICFDVFARVEQDYSQGDYVFDDVPLDKTQRQMNSADKHQRNFNRIKMGLSKKPAFSLALSLRTVTGSKVQPLLKEILLPEVKHRFTK